MRRHLPKLIPLLLLVASCGGPRDKAYCDSFKLPVSSTEYANCMSYFAKMDQWFNRDLSECHAKAVAAFPEYMYDHPRYAESFGVDRYGYTRTRDILIEPDYVRNQALDIERHKIELPCMQAKGWLSSTDWQAGRMNDKKPTPVK